MKKLLAFSTKAKIGAGIIALATMFSFVGCSNPTNSYNGIQDPNHAGNFQGIRVEVAVGVDIAHGQSALAAFQTAYVEGHLIATNLTGVTRIIITGPAIEGDHPEVIHTGNGVLEGRLDTSNVAGWRFLTAGIGEML